LYFVLTGVCEWVLLFICFENGVPIQILYLFLRYDIFPVTTLICCVSNTILHYTLVLLLRSLIPSLHCSGCSSTFWIMCLNYTDYLAPLRVIGIPSLLARFGLSCCNFKGSQIYCLSSPILWTN